MTQQYDVGILIHFPEDVGEGLKVDLLDLAIKWDGQAEADWPFSVALIPAGDFLGFLFPDPDNANLFVGDAEKYLQSATGPDDVNRLYSIVVCWSGLVGGA